MASRSWIELLSEREHINRAVQAIIDEHTERWGIKVTSVEVKDVELPSTMQRAMARQAEAEREKRARVLLAQGEYQAAQTLADAAALISKEPAALQLRYLQTLIEIGVDKNTTIVFPLQPFYEAVDYVADQLKVALGDKPKVTQNSDGDKPKVTLPPATPQSLPQNSDTPRSLEN